LGDKIVNSITDRNQGVEKILEDVLKNTGLRYKKVNEKTFVILAEKTKYRSSADFIPVNISATTNYNAQKESPAALITGRVTANDGAPLSGVTVNVKGTTRGTSTNASGVFSIEAE